MERHKVSDGDQRVGGVPPRGKGRVRAFVVRRVVPVLASRRLPVILALAAIVVSLPAVGTGLMTDDFMHHPLLAGESPSLQRLSEVDLAPRDPGRLRTALSDLFVVVDPNENLQRFRAYGALPWWIADDYRVAHWRPVASLTHWLDYRLFPDGVGLMHLHSILWFAAVMALLASFYRRFIGPGWVAGLAALLYLLSDDSYLTTMWLSNRNLLISLFFGIAALVFHDRWRRDQRRPAAVAAPLCLLISVLATEGGIATVAYLFAYEVTLGPGRWAKRLGALAPSLVVIVAWRLLYNVQGYGAAGGGFYIDPVHAPLAFLAAVAQRAPFLLAGQWTTSPPELYGFLAPGVRTGVWVVLLALVVAIPLVLWPLLRAHRRLRFWLIGMYAAALPVCATIPMARALLFVAVGAFALIAECVGLRLEKSAVPKLPRANRPLRILILALLVIHLPWASLTRAVAPAVTSKVQTSLRRTLAIRIFIRLALDQDLVIVNAPNPASCIHDPFWAVYNDRGLPGSIRMLAPGYGPLELTRTGPRRLVVRSLADGFFTCPPGLRINPAYFYRHLSDMRGPEHPLKAGDRIELPRITVDVLAVDDNGLPSEVAFLFETSLDARRWQWLFWNWKRRGFQLFRPPPVGQTVCVPGS